MGQYDNIWSGTNIYQLNLNISCRIWWFNLRIDFEAFNELAPVWPDLTNSLVKFNKFFQFYEDLENIEHAFAKL